jgi:CheY-like chemotaxis protein
MTAEETKHRVLVVDDEPITVEGVILQMEKRGLLVDCAETQAEAIRKLGVVRYSAVLLDLMLPKYEVGELQRDPPRPEHGVDVLQRIRNGEFGPSGTPKDVRVYAISALGAEQIELLNRVRQCGVEKTYGKPVSPILVAETIRMALEDAT